MGTPKGTMPWNAGTGKGWISAQGYRMVQVVEAGKRVTKRERAVKAELVEALRSLEKWFDTDEEILAALPEAERADNARQLAKIRAVLAKAGAA